MGKPSPQPRPPEYTREEIDAAIAAAPSLPELMAGPVELERLQAGLIKLIFLHNALHDDLNAMISSGRIRSTHEAMMNRPYGL